MRGRLQAEGIRAGSGNSILAPIFDRSLMAIISAVLALLVLVLAASVPAGADACEGNCDGFAALAAVATKVALIGRFVSGSPIPHAVAATYLASLVFAVFMAWVVVHTRFEKLNWDYFSSGGKAFFGRLAGYLLWLVPLFYLPHQVGKARAILIVEWIQGDRALLAAWCVGWFLVSTAVLVAIVIDFVVLTTKRGETE